MAKNSVSKKKSSIFKKLFLSVITLSILAVCLYFLDRFYPIFDPALKFCQPYFSQIETLKVKQFNTLILRQLITGISVGTIIFILLLVIIPVFMRSIDTRSYIKNIRQGIISSFIFYISNNIFSYFEQVSKFYLLLSMVLGTLITIILIYIIAKMFVNKNEVVEFKTSNWKWTPMSRQIF